MNDVACLLCCENIEAEVRKVLETSDLEDVRVIVFDQHTGDLGKERRSETDAVLRSGEGCGLLLVLGCGCMFKPGVPELEGVDSVLLGRGPELFLPPEVVEYEMERGSYMVTPGWLKGWRGHLSDKGGSISAMLKETVHEVVLLDTGTIPDIDNELRAFATHLGLPYSKLPVGVHNLRLLLESRLNNWRCRINHSFFQEAENAKRRAADYAMVFDLMGDITRLQDESELVDNVLRIYELLFSPRKVYYLPIEEDVGVGEAGKELPERYLQTIESSKGGCVTHPAGEGFMQIVSHKQEVMGAIITEGLSFPRFIDEYVNTSDFISGVLGLAIFNARIYGKLNNTIDELESEVSERMRAEERLATANNKLELLGKITRHDTLNQITVVKGYLDLMADSLEEERYQKYMERMDTAVTCMMDLIQFAREYERIGMDGAEWMGLDAILSELDRRGLELEDHCPGLVIYADKLLDKVFYNLLDNTIRHSGGARKVVVSCERSDDRLLLRWQDDGQGVPEDEKGRIFERGVGKNTGYGLFIIREMLGITGIDIVEDGVPGQGARFTMTVPEGLYRYGESSE